MLRSKADQFISKILILCIQYFRPLLGQENICPFFIGCTNFAIQSLKSEPLLSSMPKIIKRLLKCNPVWIWFNIKKDC